MDKSAQIVIKMYISPMANLGYSFLLVLTAFIWGSAFVAQVEGNVAGPFAFTCIRNFIGAAFLLGVVKVLDYVHKKRNLVSKKPVSAEEKKLLWKAGIFCGIALFFAMNLQQLGIFMGTSAGKSGFLTACYIVLVPVLGIFVGRKSSIKLWLCVAITLVGLFFLCIKGDFTIESSDCVLLLCALAFAVQIMVVDRYIAQVDGVRLSFIQFLVSAVLSIFPMIFLDIKCDMNLVVQALEGYSHLNAWIPLLYTAILSTGIAYTLQIVAQNKIEPTLASLLMSLESVFAVLSGWAVLGEHLSSRELAGCALMAVAIVLAQVNLKKG